MLQEQYEKLMQAAAEGAYMSIAVNSDGTPVRGSFVPWERTVSAFNMKKPEITIAVSDLQDAEVIDALKRCVLTGCYIAGGSLPVNCFEFCKCKVDDTSSLSEINSILSELLVWPVDGDERERWNTAKKAGVFRFYKLKALSKILLNKSKSIRRNFYESI